MNEEQKIREEAEKYAKSFGNLPSHSSEEIANIETDYIAGAKTRIPLLAEIQRLKEENEKLKGELEQANKDIDELTDMKGV